PSGMLIEKSGTATYLIIALLLTGRTAFLMWLGEQITSNGVGNGISIIIFAGIVASIPKTVGQIYETQFVGSSDQLFIHIVKIALLVIAILAVIVGVIFIQQAVRKIAIQYAKGQGRSPVGGGQ
ncbi:preprotein translocase subunit SecY, partial [Escherichia coli]|nr:preprotein translocase subunit SecY [Escherichia coli]